VWHNSGRVMLEFLETNPLLAVAILLWVLPWKGFALWKAARKEHRAWFVALLVVNTFALLEALYIFYFSERSPKAEKVLRRINSKQHAEETKKQPK